VGSSPTLATKEVETLSSTSFLNPFNKKFMNNWLISSFNKIIVEKRIQIGHTGQGIKEWDTQSGKINERNLACPVWN
jgi:hypothetical protein